jgi:hypothetical protein
MVEVAGGWHGVKGVKQAHVNSHWLTRVVYLV